MLMKPKLCPLSPQSHLCLSSRSSSAVELHSNLQTSPSPLHCGKPLHRQKRFSETPYEPYLWCEHVFDPVQSSMQSNSANQVYDQDQVWKRGSEIHNLKIREGSFSNQTKLKQRCHIMSQFFSTFQFLIISYNPKPNNN